MTPITTLQKKYITKNRARFFSLAVGSILLSACVNGTGSTSTSGSTTSNTVDNNQYPVESVIQKIKSNSKFTMVSASNDSEVTSWEIKPDGKAEFNGKTLLKATENGVYTVDGYSEDFSTEYFYSVNPYVYHGSIKDDNYYLKVVSHQTIPKKANIGDYGLFAVEERYDNPEATESESVYQYSWSLAQASADTTWLCQILTKKLEPTAPQYDEEGYTECYEIDKKGTILDAKMLVPYSDLNVTKRVGNIAGLPEDDDKYQIIWRQK